MQHINEQYFGTWIDYFAPQKIYFATKWFHLNVIFLNKLLWVSQLHVKLVAYAMCRWTLPNGSRFACTAAH